MLSDWNLKAQDPQEKSEYLSGTDWNLFIFEAQSNICKLPRSIIGNNPLLHIIDLVIMSNNGDIITVILGDKDLVIICNNDVITDVIMSNNWVITDVIMSNNGDIITVIMGNNVVITG